MEQLPTKEQILEKHYEAITVKYPNKNWLLSVYDAPESVEMMLGAMEEYAAVMVMPLVEALKKIQDITEAQGRIPEWKLVTAIRREIEAALSSYTGEQPEDEVPDEFVEHHLKRIKELQKELKEKFEAGEQPAQQPAESAGVWIKGNTLMIVISDADFKKQWFAKSWKGEYESRFIGFFVRDENGELNFQTASGILITPAIEELMFLQEAGEQPLKSEG